MDTRSVTRIMALTAILAWLLVPLAVKAEEPSPETAESEAAQGPGAVMSFFDSSHAYILNRVRGPAIWFDSFFGDPRVEEEEPAATNLRLRLSCRLVEGEGFSFPVRLRASFLLPRASRKLRIIVTGENEDEFSSVRDEESAETRTGSTEPTEKSRIGLRYNLYKTLRTKLHLGGGLRLSSPFEYYTRIRYRRFLHLGSRHLISFTETGYYNSIDGYGETTRIDLDRVYPENALGRLSLFGTYSEISRGIDWGATISLSKQFSAKTAGSVSAGVYGVTRPSTERLNYRLALQVRRNILRPWLFMEIVPEVTFPLDEVTGERGTVGAFLLLLEIQVATDQ